MISTNQLLILLAAGGAVAWYTTSKAAETVEGVKTSLDITDDENIVYSTANKIFQIDGDQRSIGSAIYDWLNPGEI